MKKQGKTAVSTLNKTKRKGKPVLVRADQAVTIANKFAVMNYPLGLLSGACTRLPIHDADVWLVPLMLTTMGLGVVGQVGTVAVDARSGKIVGSTSAEEIVREIAKLR